MDNTPAPAFRPAYPLPNSSVAVLLAALWAVFALAFCLSPFPFASQMAFCVFSILPVMFLLGDRLAGSLARPESLWSVTAFATAFIIFMGVHAITQSAPVLNRETALALLVLTATGSAAGAVVTQGPWIKRSLSALFILSFALAVIAGGWAVLLLMLPGLAITAWLALCGPSKRGYAAGVFGAALAVAGLGHMVLGLHLYNDVAVLTHADRLALWSGTARMMTDHILAGAGPGAFALVYPSIRTPFTDTSTGSFAYMDSLQIGAETGIGGFILFYALIIALLIRTIDAVIAAGPDHALRARILAPFAVLVSVFVQSHFSFPFYSPAVIAVFGGVLGVWHAATVAALGHGRFDMPRPGLVLGGLVGLGFLLLMLAVPAFMGQAMLHRAKAAQNPTDSLTLLAQADKIGPASFIDPEIELARLNLKLIEGGTFSENLKARTITETEALLDEMDRWAPEHPATPALRARVLTAQGKYHDAIGAWHIALQRDRTNTQARQTLSLALERSGHPEKAILVARDGLGYPHGLAYREWARGLLMRNNRTADQ